MAPRRIPAPVQDVCQCGSMIMMTPYTDDIRVLVPVDPGRDHDGSLVIVGSSGGGYTVRPATDADTDASQRRRAHWTVCPHPHRRPADHRGNGGPFGALRRVPNSPPVALRWSGRVPPVRPVSFRQGSARHGRTGTRAVTSSTKHAHLWRNSE